MQLRADGCQACCALLSCLKIRRQVLTLLLQQHAPAAHKVASECWDKVECVVEDRLLHAYAQQLLLLAASIRDCHTRICIVLVTMPGEA